MKVKLISYSQAADDLFNQGIQDGQELVAYCARVSNPSNQLNTETSERLIKYLIKHKHWSPLEMVNVCLEIETTRDISRQILRHRSASFQEFSFRYAKPEDLGNCLEIREARLQDPKNRQQSIELNLENTEHATIAKDWEAYQKAIATVVKEVYSWAINAGIAKEQARVILPEGMTKTKMYMNATIRSWIHYIAARGDEKEGAQKEHRLIALECAKVINKVFPMLAQKNPE